MKKIIIPVITLLTVACYNNSESEVLGRNGLCRKLSPCIEDAFAYYIKHEDNPDTSTIYLMEFLVGEPGFPQDDTLILFCACCNRQLADGIKGIMTIGEYKVLVFDKQNVGNKFYNVDSLVDIDLDRLCLPSSENLINCYAFVLDGDSNLYLLGCQPDDFVPIKIDRE
ncbi:MAG: hypothetical protein J5848_07125 [Bacteroidales bacterium]|nr:hypothetical protein [Bacteroidales bacterium]